MKLKMRVLLPAAFGMALPLIIGCGKGNDNNQNTAPAAAAPTVCGGGQVYSSQYGCLTQGSCPPGMGQVGTQCVYADNSAPGQVPSNCGAGQPNNCIPALQGYSYSNPCSGGLVYTSYGCLPQGSCQPGYAQVTTQCNYQGNYPGNYQGPYYGGGYGYRYGGGMIYYP